MLLANLKPSRKHDVHDKQGCTGFLVCSLIAVISFLGGSLPAINEVLLPYQLPLILTALLHANRSKLTISQHVSLSGHDDVALFE